MKPEDQAAIKEFKKLVNLSEKELAAWLKTDESKKVGFKEDEDEESVGHQSGTRIVKLLKESSAHYSEDDLKHVHKVVGYIHRHLAQKPKGDISETNWRYSLMNWGHDPQKA